MRETLAAGVVRATRKGWDDAAVVETKLGWG
jgi:hypothetical protein